jgi:hypothetical protein
MSLSTILTLGVILWIVLSIVIGIGGKRREIGGIRAFFISLVLSPLVGLVVILVSEKQAPVTIIDSTGRETITYYGNVPINAYYICRHPISNKFEIKIKRRKKSFEIKAEFDNYSDAKSHIKERFKEIKK